MEQAKRAGLATKDVWKQYPRAMLRARVVSEGIRTIFPGVLGGLYTPEEVQDFDTKPPKVTPPVEKVIEGEVVDDKAGNAEHADRIITMMDDCETMDCLKELYMEARKELKDDRTELKRVADKKDQVKARLDAKMAEEAEEV
jgi:hypothetical protein